jgi:hypothetical protein
MADEVTNTAVQGGQVAQSVDDEAKFKAWLRDKYKIEDDPDTFDKKRSAWRKAEEEIPQYQSTLSALIEHVKANQTQVQAAPVANAEDDEEKIRQIARMDPYEGAKRYFAKKEKELEARFNETAVQAAQQSEYAVARREGLRRAHDVVKQQWPEAFDTNTELHKLGKQVFQQEMSQQEQQHPMAFLIATERAAGRLGFAPKGKRGNSNRTSAVSAQSVSRGGVKGDTATDDKPLTARQRQIATGIGVDEKVYKEAMRVRKAQNKKASDEEDD